MVSKKEFADLQNQVINQQIIIERLQQQVNALDLFVVQISSEKALASHINDVLMEKLDEIHQYSKRSCVIMEGLPVVEDETVDQVETSTKTILVDNFGFTKETIDFEFDKAHRIGPVDGNSQKTIVKFRSHGFQSKLYKIRKNGKNKMIKVRPSLTKRREDLLFDTISNLEGVPNFHFAFADGNGNIKVRTIAKVKNKQYFNIRNTKDISDLLLFLDDSSDSDRNRLDIIDNVDKEVYEDGFCEIMLPNH